MNMSVMMIGNIRIIKLVIMSIINVVIMRMKKNYLLLMFLIIVR